MGYRYWTGWSWERISAAEAAVRRRRGDRVIQRPSAEPAPVLVPPPATPPPPRDVSLDDLDDEELAELEKLTAPPTPSGS